MNDLRDKLVNQLEQLSEISVGLWKDTDLLCVFYRGKEIAHFQNAHEIDIRLTPAIIKRRGLEPPENTQSHPERSKNSRWLVQSFTNEAEIAHIVELVKLATTV